MWRVKRFLLSSAGVFFLVIVPLALYASHHMEKSFPGNEFIVTRLSGKAELRYEMTYLLPNGNATALRLKRNSDWIPIRSGMKMGSNAVIRTAADSSVDLMIQNRMAIGLRENSSAMIERNDADDIAIQAHLRRGRLVIRVKPREGSSSQGKVPVLTVLTPVARVKVMGTSFSTQYSPEQAIARIDVLEGIVKASATDAGDSALDVAGGTMAEFSSFLRVPTMDKLPPDVQALQNDIEAMKISEDMADQWDQILQLVVESPLYRKAVSEITRYEMKVFSRSIRYFAPLRWDHQVPARLDMVELEEGDYDDPWGTPYFYEKLGAKKALLISAGEDRRLHTHDDVVMPITL